MDKSYNICCSEEFHGMAYPSFSVVFIQTFSIHPSLEFTLPPAAVKLPNEIKSETITIKGKDKIVTYPKDADDRALPIILMDRDIEQQIFVLPKNEFKKHWWQRRYRFKAENLYHFTMRGFDFTMSVIPEKSDKFPPVILKGHAFVHADLFFAHTMSLTYRFRFDGADAGVYDMMQKRYPALTDHVINFLSTYLNAEHWSESETDGKTAESKINTETELHIDKIWFDKDGKYLSEDPDSMIIKGEGRGFDNVALRYKQYIYRNCRYKFHTWPADRIAHKIYSKRHPMTVDNDSHYAMVDIWEDVQHPTKDEKAPDLFAEETGISEKAIIDHIRDWHKPELIGLMTLYPNEWVYRDANDYDEVCGEDIAIDNDDLVLAGSNVSMVIGTYGRREDDEDAMTDWVKHLKGMRKVYQVSWQEYLLILQIVLAKKHVVGLAKEKLVALSMTARGSKSLELIRQNAEMGMRLTRMVIQLDLLKYSKFASHKVMFDRTTRRLNLERDTTELKDIMEMADNGLRNLSDYKSVRSDYILTAVLAVLSIVSALGLMFQKLEMPFIKDHETSELFGFIKVNEATTIDIVMNAVTASIILAVLIIGAWIMIRLFHIIFRR